MPYEYICEDYDGDGDFRAVWFFLWVCSERSIREDSVMVTLDTFCPLWSHQLMLRIPLSPEGSLCRGIAALKCPVGISYI